MTGDNGWVPCLGWHSYWKGKGYQKSKDIREYTHCPDFLHYLTLHFLLKLFHIECVAAELDKELKKGLFFHKLCVLFQVY